MNSELKKYLENDENMGIRDEDIELINKYLDTCHPFIYLNRNKPIFKEYYKEPIFEKYYIKGNEKEIFYKLLNDRCTSSFVCISRGDISDGQDNKPNIKCKSIEFPSIEENSINGKLVFQRCHLIGYHLFRKKNDKNNMKNANLKRIFIGTRFMNNVMFYYENLVATYIKRTKDQVLYRVSPFFKEENKYIFGVQIEAMPINQDNRDYNLPFNVFIYNRQPFIRFDYGTGVILKKETKELLEKMSKTDCNYIINKRSKRFHLMCCASVCYMDKERMQWFRGKRENLISGNNIGFKCYPCAICDSGKYERLV